MEKEKPVPAPVIPLPTPGSKVQTVLFLLLIVSAFLIGSLYTKVQYLEKSGTPSQAAGAGSGGGPGAAAAPQPQAPAVGEVASVSAGDHLRGNKNAGVGLIEYSDFECPYCKQFHTTMQQIMKDYGDKVFLVYRHYPLSFHANAQKEAEASECVAELGGNDAFWKFHDAIFDRTTSNGTGFALDKLGPLAKELGINEAKFTQCLESGKHTKTVNDQMAGGTTAGITGTPGTIVWNLKTNKKEMIPGAVPLPQAKQIIDSVLK